MYPKVNQNIFIEMLHKEQSCRSIVADITVTEILIGSPMDGSMIGELSEGALLEVSFVANGNLYKFKTEVLGRKRDNILLYRIKKPLEKDVLRVQRREDFRVGTIQPAMINGHECTTINISSGGMLVSCQRDVVIEKDQLVSGAIKLPLQGREASEVAFTGEIKRIELLEEEGRKTVGIRFVQINQGDQTKILQFCFEKQRQQRLLQR